MVMKILKVITFVLVFVVLFTSANLVFGETAGETLKGMGLVVGFKDGNLHEEAYMKQGEVVALVGRYIMLNFIPKTYTAVLENNSFDRFVNKAFNFIIKSYYNTKIFFIKLYYTISNKEIYPGVSKSNYLFPQLVMLKAYGFVLPDGIVIDAKVTQEDFYNIVYGMLGFGDGEFKKDSNIPYGEKLRIINSIHGKGKSLISGKNGYLKRSEVFEEFLRLVKATS